MTVYIYRSTQLRIEHHEHLESSLAPVLEHDPCYSLSRATAIENGIIRDLAFQELNDSRFDILDMTAVYDEISDAINNSIIDHDHQDPATFHQAMVLTQTVEGLNSANEFEQMNYLDVLLKQFQL